MTTDLHPDKAPATEAVVTATTDDGERWLLLIERRDLRGWALPAGAIDPEETTTAAAERKLFDDAGLRLPAKAVRHIGITRVIDDPGAGEQAWLISTPVYVDLGEHPDVAALPAVHAGDDATQAAWIRAATFTRLIADLVWSYRGKLFPAHIPLLQGLLDDVTTLQDGWNLEEHIDDTLDGAGPDRLRELASDYLRLVSEIQLTMPDMDDWEIPGLSEVERLTRYIEHLCRATYGVCALCGREICAPHLVADLPRRRWWDPRRLAAAIRDFFGTLRYGPYRVAHTSCAQGRPW